MEHEEKAQIFYAGMQLIAHKILLVVLEMEKDLGSHTDPIDAIDRLLDLIEKSMKITFSSPELEADSIKAWVKLSAEGLVAARANARKRSEVVRVTCS